MTSFKSESTLKLYRETLDLLKQNNLEQALGLSQRLLQLEPEVEWCLKLAQTLKQPLPQEALKWFERALELAPEQPLALKLAGNLAYQLKDFNRALEHWIRLSKLAPTAQLLTNIGGLQLKSGQFALAADSLRQALNVQADFEAAQYQLVYVLLRQQAFEEALNHLESVLDKHPELSETVLDAGLILLQKHHLLLAERYLELCCKSSAKLSKERHEIYALLAECALYRVDQPKLQQYYQLAQACAPHPLTYSWSRLRSLPYIYESHEHLESVRQNFREGLNDLVHEVDQALAAKEDLLHLLKTASPAFLLAYQGQDNRELMETIGQVWHKILKTSKRLITTGHKPQAGRRIRLGFISSFFYNHSVLKCYGQRIIDCASHEAFEVSCIYLGERTDKQTLWLKDKVQHFIHFKGIPHPQMIADLELDILVYTDIGMELKTYQLAFHRLAPIQIVISGHPETTGLPNMDYYLSNKHSEADDAQKFYSETLLLLPEGMSRMSMPEIPDQLTSRAELGMQPDARIYFCPMTLFKIHPDFDLALAEILRQDPKALIYLAADTQALLNERLHQRFQQQFGILAERIIFLPWMKTKDFYSAILQADVILDSFYFGAGTTASIILGLGQPIVCWPTELQRGRMTYGKYVKMGLTDHVPRSPEAYVKQALRLANDSDYRQQLIQLIAEHKHKIFVSAEEQPIFAKLLQAIVKQYPQKLTQNQLDALELSSH